MSDKTGKRLHKDCRHFRWERPPGSAARQPGCALGRMHKTRACDGCTFFAPEW